MYLTRRIDWFAVSFNTRGDDGAGRVQLHA
jgi:inner membrane protein involved in colicin E2 resistance